MVTNDPRDALALAHEHARRLREESAADRLRPASGSRRAFAGSLRRAADWIYPVPLARRPA
jgi:hypothetical protein